MNWVRLLVVDFLQLFLRYDLFQFVNSLHSMHCNSTHGNRSLITMNENSKITRKYCIKLEKKIRRQTKLNEITHIVEAVHNKRGNVFLSKLKYWVDIVYTMLDARFQAIKSIELSSITDNISFRMELVTNVLVCLSLDVNTNTFVGINLQQIDEDGVSSKIDKAILEIQQVNLAIVFYVYTKMYLSLHSLK